MKKLSGIGLLVALAVAGAGSVAGGPERPAASPASAALKRAETMYWQRLQKESLPLRVRLGLPVDDLPDLTFEKCEHDAAFGRTLAALVPPRTEGLTHEEELSAEILRREARALAEAPDHYWLTFPATPYTFQFIGVSPVFAAHPFRGKDDAGHYEKLLSRYAGLLQSIETKLREQARRNIVIARAEIPLVAGAFAAAGREGEQNLFWVRLERLSALAPAEREEFSTRLAREIDTQVRPAVRRLTEYLTGEYAAKAPESVGLGQYPGGKDYYRWLVRRTTTLDITPEQIHQIGLESMERINAALEETRKRLKFEGSLADFRRFLKIDSRFYVKTPEEVGERLMAAQNRVLPRIPDFFGHGPKAPFGVKRLEPQLEGALTFGYYQRPTPEDPKGYYKFNGTHLDERSLIGAGSLISHELVPGHHFQINLQQENGDLPPYRREALSYTAFVEGWGEYASYLAGEMGMYADPYDLCGRLLFDAFLTSRLVLDTGMNLLGWPRARAMEYMRQNTNQSDTEIETETLRYSSDLPSQALAYKMGMRKFVELREKARAALGPGFDMRRYHDMLLASGAVPLDLAQRKVDWFIAEEKARVAQSPSSR